MNRSQFLTGAGALLGTALFPAAARAATTEESEIIKQIARDYFFTFFNLQDKAKFRAMLTDDYLILEHGELLDLAGDLALMPGPADEYKRTDSFDFHQVRIHGDTAWSVYTLRSDITDKKKGPRHREYLESMIMRRTADRWLVALLHSTRLTAPTK